MADAIGYVVTICDAREPFIRSPRFSANAEVVVDWPDRYLEGRELAARDVVLVFTHDPKFDEPALIGGARQRRRIRRRARQPAHPGAPRRAPARGRPRRASIARIHAPCGLDVGARTPAETAISILAEIIALRTGRSAEPLRETTGPIHATEAESTAATDGAGARAPVRGAG